MENGESSNVITISENNERIKVMNERLEVTNDQLKAATDQKHRVNKGGTKG